MRTHAVKWGLLVTVAALCFVGYAGVQGALGVMEGWTKNLPSIEDTDFTNTSRESVMYAGDEATLLAEFQLEKRDPVTYEEISPYVLEGTVDTEDVRFYEHEGVDIPGIARAFVNNLRGGDLEGASTITQQLVRNTVLSEEATDISFERKIREAELAIDLEKRFSKDDILVKYAGDEATLLAEFQLEKRDPVTYEEISPYVLEGTVDTEDVRFYEHEGVDIPGIARAFVNNLRGGDLEGASTITQQLVRNTVLSEEATDISFERKIREAELAIDLEKRFSKDDILVKYLNIINYGDGCYGIEAAAQNYFQVSALDLTLAQAATLVGIPQSPTYLNPKVYPDACLARRNVVLDRMLSAGDITQQEHDDAQAEELGLNPAPDAPADGIYAYPFFTSYVRSLLFDENNPYGCSYADLFKGGLTIYTSLDPELQDAAQAAVDNQRANMADNLDASIVAIDVATGQVKAMTRGVPYGQGEGESQVNIATGDGGTGRQAGSTFKAFTLAAAIEQGISPQTLVDCTSPLKKGQDGAPEDFENFNGNDYGIQTIQSATAISSNTGYLRLSNSIGQASTTEMASRLGVTSPMQPVYTATEGVADVNPLEMASAYATLASGGVKREPTVITKILDRDGNVIWPQEESDTGERVLDEKVAAATTKVLETVFTQSNGTATSARLNSGQPVAGKTGTASSFTDHWLVGYTPSLSCAAWIGDPSGAIETDHGLTANALWKDFMDRATSGKAIENFPTVADPPYNNPYNIAQKNKLGKKVEEEKDEDGESREKDVNSAPSAVGKTFEEAIQILNGYKAGYIEEYSDTVPEGTVISQSVQEGKVVIVVSKGPKP